MTFIYYPPPPLKFLEVFRTLDQLNLILMFTFMFKINCWFCIRIIYISKMAPKCPCDWKSSKMVEIRNYLFSSFHQKEKVWTLVLYIKIYIITNIKGSK